MSPIYGISKYGKIIVIDEGEEYASSTPPIRIIFLAINCLLFIVPVIKLTGQYLSHRKKSQEKSSTQRSSSLSLITSIFITFVVNNAIRSSHMVDHMYRPVYYFEPKWAYQKYLITEMDSGTVANIQATIFGYLGVSGLLQSLQTGTIIGKYYWAKLLIYNLLYTFLSMFTLVHYTIESPCHYGSFPNFNIAGAAITALPFIGICLYALCCKNLRLDRGDLSSTVEIEQSEKLLEADKGREEKESGGQEGADVRRRPVTPAAVD